MSHKTKQVQADTSWIGHKQQKRTSACVTFSRKMASPMPTMVGMCWCPSRALVASSSACARSAGQHPVRGINCAATCSQCQLAQLASWQGSCMHLQHACSRSCLAALPLRPLHCRHKT